MNHTQILIIDDEQTLAEATKDYFRLSGLSADFVTTSNSALLYLKSHTIDIILLDINLGDTSGFDLCKQIRQITNAPIIFISARSSNDDILLALGIGGDDYIQKPYTLSVLNAKVQAVLKRLALNHPSQPQKATFSDIEIDFSANKVYKAHEEIPLKAQEYKLLTYLVTHPNQVISKEELFTIVWGGGYVSDGTLNVHIRKLREKIEETPSNPKHIKTVWGVGYIFEVEI